MTITIKNTEKEYTIELFGMLPDTSWENMNIEDIDNEHGNPCEMSQEEFDEWLEFWEGEVEQFNRYGYSEFLGKKYEEDEEDEEDDDVRYARYIKLEFAAHEGTIYDMPDNPLYYINSGIK